MRLSSGKCKWWRFGLSANCNCVGNETCESSKVENMSLTLVHKYRCWDVYSCRHMTDQILFSVFEKLYCSDNTIWPLWFHILLLLSSFPWLFLQFHKRWFLSATGVFLSEAVTAHKSKKNLIRWSNWTRRLCGRLLCVSTLAGVVRNAFQLLLLPKDLLFFWG